MQGNSSGQGSNQNSNKSGGLSWSMPASSSQGSTSNQTSPLMGGSKPASAAPASKQTSTPAVTKAQMQSDSNRARGWGMFLAGAVVGALVMWGWNGFGTPAGVGQNATSTTTGTGVTNTTNSGTTGGTIGGTGATTQNTGSTGQTKTNTNTNTNTKAKPGTASTNSIEVGPQDAGMSVVVADATVSQPTWFAVYELVGGQPTKVLGATMFFPEYNGKGGIISLLRPTQPKTTYFIGQRIDNGDHKYSPTDDKRIVDANGNIMGTTFTTR